MKTDWIKMTDRAPTEADLPVWAYFKDCGDQPSIIYRFPPMSCTHWRPAKDDVPEPPQIEVAQTDQDEFWALPADAESYAAMHAQIVRALERADFAATYERDATVALRAIGIVPPRTGKGRK